MDRFALRVARLKTGNWQFGHGGSHIGTGKPGCPKKSHHHHDSFCEHPSKFELEAAGIDPTTFKARSRRAKY